MSELPKKVFEFGPFRLDCAERVLLRDGQPVPVTLKAFDVLMLLVENGGHLVEKDELMNRVWAGSFVEEGNLKVTVSMLRKALEDNQPENRFIETVPRRGYRFIAPVSEVRPPPAGCRPAVRASTQRCSRPKGPSATIDPACTAA